MVDVLNTGQRSMSFSDYEKEIDGTDILSPHDLAPVQMGLYGEVGGIMSAAKKHVREGEAYVGFRKAAIEEFGDTLWYFTALCRRLGLSVQDIFTEASQGADYRNIGTASDHGHGSVAHVAVPAAPVHLDSALFDLGQAAAALLVEAPAKADMVRFAADYVRALHGSKLPFATVVRENVKKTRQAFITPDPAELVDFDWEFKDEEQLPRKFRVKISQRASGKTYLQWNDVFIGDPLTDNIADRDGYRFHDVFHFAHAAILHWSPVMRALIKQKRKSSRTYDEEQDSGRAIVVEEGVTAWIFSRAKELNFFEEQERISFGLLKTVSEFVAGYEVAKCPPKLWERAILDGYAVFRQLRDAEGGWIVGDRVARTITFEPLKDEA